MGKGKKSKKDYIRQIASKDKAIKEHYEKLHEEMDKELGWNPLVDYYLKEIKNLEAMRNELVARFKKRFKKEPND